MDYEKEYKKALDRARRLHSEPTGGTERIVCEQIFPELKESEDERIRKAAIAFVKASDHFGYHLGISKENVLAWLEKQKPSDEALEYIRENHSPSEVSDFQAAMNIAVTKAYDQGRVDAITWIEKQGQKETTLDDYEYPPMNRKLNPTDIGL